MKLSWLDGCYATESGELESNGKIELSWGFFNVGDTDEGKLRTDLDDTSSDNMDSSMETQEENSESNQIEKTKISVMRTLVETQDPSSKIVQKASAMFLKYQKWRRSFVPGGPASPSEVTHEIGQNKMFLQGSCKKGRPILVGLAAKHFPNKGGLEELKRCPQEKRNSFYLEILKVGDMQTATSVDTLQFYLPCRTTTLKDKVFIVHAPYIFMTVWKIAYPFIDEKTRKKIAFVDNKKLNKTLLEEIDESQLPEKYGGRLPLVLIHDS
ncbi:hypothetical protein DITRI_Ditri04bG0014400 [Diplodiscus trichospermus]